MRYLPNSFIRDTWESGGPFAGPTRTVGRVTVEPDWQLTVVQNAGNFAMGPVRWWRRNEDVYDRMTVRRTEVEVPNVKSIQWDKSLDNDSATCTITLNNQWHYDNGVLNVDPSSLGQPGYFSPFRGLSKAAQTRWGQSVNAWTNVLIPNALMRSYEGYGGGDVDIPTAVRDGNLLITGTWLVDTVTINTDGNIVLACRDMAKLLIEQQTFPPLIPSQFYPNSWSRWQYNTGTTQAGFYGPKTTHPNTVTASPITYDTSSLDVASQQTNTPFPDNVGHPHYPADASDLDITSTYISEGYPNAVGQPWIQWATTATDDLGVVALTPRSGGYTAYISLEVTDGTWAGHSTIPPPGTSTGRIFVVPGAAATGLAATGTLDLNAQIAARTGAGVPSSGLFVSPIVIATLGYAVIPRVLFGVVYTSAQATAIYNAYHQHLGIFDSLAHANAYVSDLNSWLATRYGGLFYVGKVAVPAGKTTLYRLPAANTVDPRLANFLNTIKFRLTLSNLENESFGPLPNRPAYDQAGTYRAGLQEVAIGTLTAAATTYDILAIAQPGFSGTDARRGHLQGYWLFGSDGQVTAVGPNISIVGSAASSVDAPRFQDLSAMFLSESGCWGLRGDGRVAAWGTAPHYGDLFGSVPWRTNPMRALDRRVDNNGYWMVNSTGVVTGFSASSAPNPDSSMNYGNLPSGSAVDLAGVGTTGYYILEGDGTVHAFGSATYYGSTPTLQSGVSARAIATHSDINGAVNGYWVLTSSGAVFGFGSVGPFLQHYSYTAAPFMDICQSQIGENGYLVVASDGRVFAGGVAKNWGDITTPGSWNTTEDGSYTDWTQIVQTFLLWSGWLLYDPNLPPNQPPDVFGNIEFTGAYSLDLLPESMFDKRPVQDVIKDIKELAGFNTFVDEDGGYHFELPTWFAQGNFINETGQYTLYVPQADERKNLMAYAVQYNDTTVRSQIIVSTDDPTADLAGTMTATINAQSPMLRGMVRPAMLINGAFLNQLELNTMAELIALQLHFQQRLGTATIAGNPMLQVTDKIRIFERISAESAVHYIRGISSNHDLDAGTWTMDLTTNWLGEWGEGSWAVRFQRGSATVGPQVDGTFVLSADTLNQLKAMTSRVTPHLP